MTLYPLLMAPCFRSGIETPWGGSMLRDAFMKEAPARCGESLEVSTLPAQQSSVRNGQYAGVTLTHMHKLWGEALTGAADEIPLRVKLIDAAQAVNCEATPAAAWVVLNCEPGTTLTAGEDFAARPGDVYALPAGLPRALGADMQLYALEADAPDEGGVSAKLRGVTSLCAGGSRTYYVCNRYFEFCRLNISGVMPLSDGRMLLLTPLAPCTLRWGDEALELDAFDTVVVPAALEGVRIVSDDCKALMAAIPRRAALRAELGYRAEGVHGLSENSL